MTSFIWIWLAFILYFSLSFRKSGLTLFRYVYVTMNATFQSVATAKMHWTTNIEKRHKYLLFPSSNHPVLKLYCLSVQFHFDRRTWSRNIKNNKRKEQTRFIRFQWQNWFNFSLHTIETSINIYKYFIRLFSGPFHCLHFFFSVCLFFFNRNFVVFSLKFSLFLFILPFFSIVLSPLDARAAKLQIL